MSRAKLSSLIFEARPVRPTSSSPEAIPIEAARLCLDCEVICQSTRCPQCAGRSLHPITAWLKAMPQPVLRLERRRPGQDRRQKRDQHYKDADRRKTDRRRSPR